MPVQVVVSSSHGRPTGSSPSHSERQGRAAMHECSGQGCVNTGSMLSGDHGEQRQDYRGSCSQHGLLGKKLPWETLMGGVLSPEALRQKLGSLVLESPAPFPVPSQLEEHSVLWRRGSLGPEPYSPRLLHQSSIEYGAGV